jgi:hypothetical protein
VSIALADDEDWRIVVSDNGPGVPKDKLAEIFKDGYTTKSPRGELRRGIGLALVKRLVHKAGGSIFATAGPGGHFEVSLPRPAPARRVPSSSERNNAVGTEATPVSAADAGPATTREAATTPASGGGQGAAVGERQ